MVMDTFQGWYKDGTEGTSDYRQLSALYLLLRIGLAIEFLVVILVNQRHRGQWKWLIPGVIHIFLGTFHFVAKPYKKRWMSNTDGMILSLIGVLLLMANYRERDMYLLLGAVSVLLLVPFSFLLLQKCIHRLRSS